MTPAKSPGGSRHTNKMNGTFDIARQYRIAHQPRVGKGA